MSPFRRACIVRSIALASVACAALSFAPGVEPAGATPAALTAEPEPIPIPKPVELWAKDVPGATGDTDEDRPAIYPFLPPQDRNTGAAVLVCPGGGFHTRCVDFEGVQVARWLNARGIAGFVLRYRIRPLYGLRESVQDANRAMQFIREHAAEYRVAPDRVGIIGFSAGAELAAAATFAPVAGKADAADPIDRHPGRANFMILVYGGGPPRAAGKDVPAGAVAGAPPTFLFCTAEDGGHLTGMADLYAELRRARVPAEAHFFERGEHGVALAQGDPVLGVWPGMMYNWVRAGGFLTGQKRVAVKGVVRVDGEPLAHGSVVFTPLDAVGAPPATACVLNTGAVRGQYTIAADRGLTPGKYRVEVRQDATRWLSNSRDPVYQKMTQKQRTGTLTDEDRKEWSEYTRKRNLSPSIEDLRVFRTRRPGDEKELVVEVKAAGENQFDLDVFTK